MDDFRIFGSSWRFEDSEVFVFWEEKLEYIGKVILIILECWKFFVF